MYIEPKAHNRMNLVVIQAGGWLSNWVVMTKKKSKNKNQIKKLITMCG